MAKREIKQPVKNGVAKVPVIMQLEALECGAASLAMLMAYYDKWVPLEQVRADCGVSRDGSKAKNIALAAMHYGFDIEAYRFDPKTIQTQATFPCIIHWNMNHFVVLDGFKGNRVYLNDPARGDVVVTMEEFDESFTGVTILATPGEQFEPSGKPKSTLDFARKRLVGAGAAVVFVMVTTAISYLFGIINSFTSRIFMDRLLSGKNADWLYPFITGLVVLAVLQLIVASHHIHPRRDENESARYIDGVHLYCHLCQSQGKATPSRVAHHDDTFGRKTLQQLLVQLQHQREGILHRVAEEQRIVGCHYTTARRLCPLLHRLPMESREIVLVRTPMDIEHHRFGIILSRHLEHLHHSHLVL